MLDKSILQMRQLMSQAASHEFSDELDMMRVQYLHGCVNAVFEEANADYDEILATFSMFVFDMSHREETK